MFGRLSAIRDLLAESEPLYYPDVFPAPAGLLEMLVNQFPWETVTEARDELFMSPGGGVSYTYGQGRGAREYLSIDEFSLIKNMRYFLNGVLLGLGYKNHINGCFLNRYSDDHKHLGWHADDFVGMDHEVPVVVISFGEPREIWWRVFGQGGVVPPECRQILEPGSMLIMPPGFQHTHQHRIPKGGRSMGPRVSMTFRGFLS